MFIAEVFKDTDSVQCFSAILVYSCSLIRVLGSIHENVDVVDDVKIFWKLGLQRVSRTLHKLLM